MRDMQGLVDSLVSYIEQEERPDDKVMSTIMVLWFSEGVCVCVMDCCLGLRNARISARYPDQPFPLPVVILGLLLRRKLSYILFHSCLHKV